MTAGTVVRMSSGLRRALRRNGCRDHVAEFGGKAGLVVGPADLGGGVVGPDVDVRWIPRYLRYAYSVDQLVVSRKKIRGWRKKEELARRTAVAKGL